MFFNKDFYEMLSDIKACQSETVNQCSPYQNSASCCTLGCLFTKGSLLILTSSCHICLHHTKYSSFTDWMVSNLALQNEKINRE